MISLCSPDWPREENMMLSFKGTPFPPMDSDTGRIL